MVALEQEARDACLGEARDLAVEEQGDGGIAPVAIENIARENGESDFFLQRAVDRFLEGLAAGARELRGQMGVAQAKPLKWTAQMQVGGVEEGERHQESVGGDSPSSQCRT